MSNLGTITSKNDGKEMAIQNVNNWTIRVRKINMLLNLIQKQDNDSLIDKIYLYANTSVSQNVNFRLKNVKMLE